MTTRQRKYAIEGRGDAEAGRIDHMVAHMDRNLAYASQVEQAGGDPDGRILEAFQDRYRRYRRDWREQPRNAVDEGLLGAAFEETGAPPLCIDIEVAAVCDLACPFCFRQTFATPDKIIEDELCYRIIDQAVDMGVPSLKFNWRGEPLLNPRLPEYIAYAKQRGILETIINTNATKLDPAVSGKLIDAGLDLMIYSFDGGTKDTYERMRPGRFAPNSFDAVYGNIRRFAELRDRRGAVFPRTKIQMILTGDSFDEQDAFFRLFEDCVDDVTVKQYTERGAGLADLDEATRTRLSGALTEHGLPADSPYMRDMDGNLFVALGRLPCEQPYQRLLVTYDGRVAMCCYDWGAQHPIGYMDDSTIRNREDAYADIVEKTEAGAKGFELMGRVGMPAHHNAPAARVSTLSELWYGHEIDHVRACHVEDRGGDVEICRTCQFKETYQWRQVAQTEAGHGG